MSHYTDCGDCGCIPCACHSFVIDEDSQDASASAIALIRRMAERFDGASNGKCKVCGAGRANGAWWFDANDTKSIAPECNNPACLSRDIRTFILNAER